VTPEEDKDAVGWGRAASPLVVDDLVIVPLGGPEDGPFHSLAAFHKLDGTLQWKGGDDQVSYASPTLTTLCRRRQVVIVNESTVSGHALEDGTTLWSYPWEGNSDQNATCSQAVMVGDDRVLLSKGYGTGAELIQLYKTPEEGFRVESLWADRTKLKTKFTNVVVRDGYVYGLSDGILECVELDTGRRRWKTRRGDYGHGQILGVGDVLLVQAENGEVVMVEMNPTELNELGRFEALTDKTWNTLCLYGTRLLVRNAREAACYELALRSSPKKSSGEVARP
jgi:outer membrane protein assembly factor BamB